MGGGDAANVTTGILAALARCRFPPHAEVDVVVGHDNPWAQEINEAAQGLPVPVTVSSSVDTMAQLTAACDLAIGAGGTTSWERCCLGVPTLLVVTADNQRHNATQLQRAGAALAVGNDLSSLAAETESLISDPERLRIMARAAAALVDGLGAGRVADAMASGILE
jgi:spore coat polysaccharide biosynthesis predicted glycosyltransferase SpsG